MIQELDLLLSDDELATLLGLSSLKPTKDSPLHEFPTVAVEAVRDSLSQLGAINDASEVRPDIIGALSVLCEPIHVLTLLSGSPERSDSMSLYCQELGADTDFAGFRRVMSQEGERNHISFPIGTSDLMGLIADNMRLGDEVVGGIFNAELSVPGFLALAAVADSYQKESIQSTLSRNQFTGAIIESEELSKLAQDGLDQLDIRWTVSLLSSLCPFSLTADNATLESGIQNLEATGAIITPEENGPPVLTGDSVVFCDSLIRVPFYYAMRIGKVNGPASFMAAVRADDLIWLFEFAGTDPATGRVRLSNLTNEEFRSTVEKNYLSAE